MKAVGRAACVAAQRRSIHSVYGGFKNQGAGALSSAMNWGDCRGSQNTHFKELAGHENLTSAGRKLLSNIEHNTDRLLACDWTTDFSGFWADEVSALASEKLNMYHGGENPIFALCSNVAKATPEEIAVVTEKLNYLQSAFAAANGVQEVYTVIFDERFRMQRGVWDAVEREKILAGCTELYEDFIAKVPAEFKRKAQRDLEWHLYNLRHWVWDAPNVKAAFPITMN